MNETIRHLLGYLNESQVKDAIAHCGKEPVREVMRAAGWEDAYDWEDEQ